MTKFEMLKDQVEMAKLITQEWDGFSAEILSYCGHPGIAGHLKILFRSPIDKSFMMIFGICDLIETRFRWQIECLKIDFDEDSKKVIVTDSPNDFKIRTDSLRIYEFSNDEAVSKLYIQSLLSRELQPVFPSIQRLNSLSQIDTMPQKISEGGSGIINNSLKTINKVLGKNNNKHYDQKDIDRTELLIQDFKIHTNLVYTTIRYHTVNGEDISGSSIILLKDPTRFYFKRRCLLSKDIEIQELNQSFRLINNADNSLFIECNEIQICDHDEFTCYYYSIPNFVSWWSDMIFIGHTFKMIPREIVSIWPF
jgi:hypothetical protein